MRYQEKWNYSNLSAQHLVDRQETQESSCRILYVAQPSLLFQNCTSFDQTSRVELESMSLLEACFFSAVGHFKAFNNLF